MPVKLLSLSATDTSIAVKYPKHVNLECSGIWHNTKAITPADGQLILETVPDWSCAIIRFVVPMACVNEVYIGPSASRVAMYSGLLQDQFLQYFLVLNTEDLTEYLAEVAVGGTWYSNRFRFMPDGSNIYTTVKIGDEFLAFETTTIFGATWCFCLA